MENPVFAKVGGFLQQGIFILFLLLSFIPFILIGCASSAVERTAEANIDKGVVNAKTLVDNASDSSLSATVANTSQTVKGAVVGGASGAIAGSVVTGIGALPGAAIGTLMGASYGRYIESEATLKDKLMNRGANVVMLGDQILIILSSADIFRDMTPDIKTSAFSTLYLVSAYVSAHVNTLVKISAYSNDTGSKRVDLALTQQQANSLVRFFTATGMDSRLIYGAGYGGTHLVARNTLDWDHSDNYRIEITLEKLYLEGERAC